MTNTQLIFLIFQAWLIVAVAHPLHQKSNACFIHSLLWMGVWIFMVVR